MTLPNETKQDYKNRIKLIESTIKELRRDAPVLTLLKKVKECNNSNFIIQMDRLRELTNDELASQIMIIENYPNDLAIEKLEIRAEHYKQLIQEAE